jgi:peptidoglycan/LPS O-acetylase OafA/YrhL
MAYSPSLDGLRAFAVVAVIFFHQSVNWLPAGFLGVDVFFVISGFLITSLLVQEFRGTGRIRLPSFWARRARRLLPALFFMLFVVTGYALLRAHDAVGRLRVDVPGAVFYVTNWVGVFRHTSYFANLGRPPLLQHLWSLAIEEQFYLIWPIVLLGGMRLVKGRAVRLVPFIVAGAIGSTALMWIKYVPNTDPTRVYYGTDTHAMGLLTGAALACCWAPWKRPLPERASRALDYAAGASLVALAFIMWTWDAYTTRLYQGGFLVVSVLAAVVIAACAQPGRGPMRNVLAWAPLVYIGTRSYGLYLWHWPIFQLMRPEDMGGLTGVPLFILRLAVTFAITEFSYRFVEARFRHPPGPEQRTAWPRERVYAAFGLAVTTVFALGFQMAVINDTSAAVPVGGDAAPVPVATPDTAGGPSTTAPSQLITSEQAALPRRVVVVGDSQAKALYANRPDTPGITLADGGVEGCSLEDTGTMLTTAHYRRSFTECQGWDSKWSNAARANNAQIALVVIGAWDVFDLNFGDGPVPFGSAAHDAYLTSQLKRGIAQLESAGARVALMEVPCYRPIDAGGLIRLPERGDDARTRHLDDLLRAAAHDDPTHVFFVPGPADFCTNSQIGTGTRYRWDGVHYLRPGATLVFDVVGPELLNIPVPR